METFLSFCQAVRVAQTDFGSLTEEEACWGRPEHPHQTKVVNYWECVLHTFDRVVYKEM